MSATSPTRALPNRRGHETVDLIWQGRDDGPGLAFKLSCGRELGPRANPIGPVLEVFADGPKFGTEMAGLLRDSCKLISFMLRGGWSARAIADKLNGVKWEPAKEGDGLVAFMMRPDSIVGFIALGAAAEDGDASAKALLEKIKSGGGA